jgi:hypothetical protein
MDLAGWVFEGLETLHARSLTVWRNVVDLRACSDFFFLKINIL